MVLNSRPIDSKILLLALDAKQTSPLYTINPLSPFLPNKKDTIAIATAIVS